MRIIFPGRHHWKESFLVLLFWSVAAVLFASQTYLHCQTAGRPVAFSSAYLHQWVSCILWAILTPVILALAERYRVERNIWGRRVALHTGFSIVLAVFQRAAFTLFEAFQPLLPGKADAGLHMEYFAKSIFFLFDYGIPIYWAILAVHHSLTYHKKSGEESLRASELEARLVHTELDALKMQLHPRFLFTTLNFISGLMKRDMRAADKMIARLGDFLRITLESSGDQKVTLQRELDFLRCYLEIERVRLKDRLKVVMDIDPHTIHLQVPNFILQPIVENAILRWIPEGAVSRRIGIRADCNDGMLRIQIADNGPSIRGSAYSEGFGIINTRTRLRRMYGDAHNFFLGAGPKGGMVAILEIPMKFTEAVSAA